MCYNYTCKIICSIYLKYYDIFCNRQTLKGILQSLTLIAKEGGHLGHNRVCTLCGFIMNTLTQWL